jgi:tetratricopeptide (TPR) repeat protein
VEDLLDPPRPVTLRRLEGPNAWQKMLTALITAVKHFQGHSVHPDLIELVNSQAASFQCLEPLQLLMTGLLLAIEEQPKQLVQGRLELARGLAAVELGRIRKLAEDRQIPEEFFSHLLLSVTLQQGGSADDIQRLIEEESAAERIVPLTGRGNILNALQDATPGQQPLTVDPIRPDLVAEAVILTAVTQLRLSPKEQSALAERCWRRAGRAVVASVVRIVQDYAGPDQIHPALAWLDHLIGLTDDLVELMAIAAELPQRTIVLRERAVSLQTRIAEDLQALGQNTPMFEVSRAAVLNNLGGTLSALGKRKEALAAAQQAVALYRGLMLQSPVPSQRDFAAALNNLGGTLSALARHKEALAATREAVELYRSIASQHPKDFQQNLASALNNLSGRLSALGCHEQALEAAEEAVELYKFLTSQHPEVFQQDLAAALNNWGSTLSALGRHDQALKAAEEAVALYKILLSQHPDGFYQDLAAALNNLGRTLSALTRHFQCRPTTDGTLQEREEKSRDPPGMR